MLINTEVREELPNVLLVGGEAKCSHQGLWAFQWDWISLALQMFLMGFKMRCLL
jgi:hypothetical protein